MTGAAPSFEVGGERRLAVNMPSATAFLEAVDAALVEGRGFTAATLNLDHLVKARGDPQFRAAYMATDLVVADGHPIVWLARLQRAPVALAPGSDLVAPLCATAARRGAPVALFGSTQDVLDAAAMRLEARNPGLKIVLKESPPYGFDPEGVAAEACAGRIAESGARLCLLALGAPKQERFAARARAIAPQCGFVSIGAGLDFIAGRQRRAPALVRRLALEWLWRAGSDPRRLAMRYLSCAALLPGLAMDSAMGAGRARTPPHDPGTT